MMTKQEVELDIKRVQDDIQALQTLVAQKSAGCERLLREIEQHKGAIEYCQMAVARLHERLNSIPQS